MFPHCDYNSTATIMSTANITQPHENLENVFNSEYQELQDEQTFTTTGYHVESFSDTFISHRNVGREFIISNQSSSQNREYELQQQVCQQTQVKSTPNELDGINRAVIVDPTTMMDELSSSQLFWDLDFNDNGEYLSLSNYSTPTLLPDDMSSFGRSNTGQSSISQMSTSHLFQQTVSSQTDDFPISPPSVENSNFSSKQPDKPVLSLLTIRCREKKARTSGSCSSKSTKKWECFIDNCKKTAGRKCDLWRHIYESHFLFRPISFYCYICKKRRYPSRRNAVAKHIKRCQKIKLKNKSTGITHSISKIPNEEVKIIDESDNIYFCEFVGCQAMAFGKKQLEEHVFQKHDHINKDKLEYLCPYCGELQKYSRTRKILEHEEECKKLHHSSLSLKQLEQQAVGENSTSVPNSQLD